MPSTNQTGSNSHVVGKRLLCRFRLAVLCDHSAATCAPFAATERFMKKTSTTRATATTAKMKRCRNRRAPRIVVRADSRGFAAPFVRGHRIAGLLKKAGPNLIEVRIHRRIERIEIFAEAQGVKLVAPFLNCLRNGSSDAAAFVAQQREQTDRGAAQLGRNVQKGRDIQRREDRGEAQ